MGAESNRHSSVGSCHSRATTPHSRTHGDEPTRIARRSAALTNDPSHIGKRTSNPPVTGSSSVWGTTKGQVRGLFASSRYRQIRLRGAPGAQEFLRYEAELNARHDGQDGGGGKDESPVPSEPLAPRSGGSN